MILTKKTSVPGDWLKFGEDIEDQGTIKILDEGKKVAGDYGERDVFKVLAGDKERNVSFNQTSINNLVEAFGGDTLNWIGRTVKLWAIKQMVSNKIRNVMYFAPTSWTMTDEGEFLPPLNEGVSGKSEEAPATTTSAPEQPPVQDEPPF